jgi:hypothetical protein
MDGSSQCGYTGFADEWLHLHAHFLAVEQGAFQGKYVVATIDVQQRLIG